MSLSTGRGCQLTKLLLLDSASVLEHNILGSLVNKDDLSEILVQQIELIGCDWPTFESTGSNLNIYFGCCCQKGSVIKLSAKLVDEKSIKELEKDILAIQEGAHENVAWYPNKKNPAFAGFLFCLFFCVFFINQKIKLFKWIKTSIIWNNKLSIFN